MTDFEAHLARQIAWSRATFGPGTSSQGVTDHIKKEIKEVEAAETNEERIKEWTDIAILALDGLWREIAYGLWGHESPRGRSEAKPTLTTAAAVVQSILSKQSRNELREWPDWRTADPNKAIEHIRTVEETIHD